MFDWEGGYPDAARPSSSWPLSWRWSVLAQSAPAVSVSGPPHMIVSPQPGNRYGFEGGQVTRVGTRFYWFTTELTAAPFQGKTTLALWISSDGIHFRRLETLLGPSSANNSGKDRRAALWSPMPIYDALDHHWRLFYVSYRSLPTALNYDGEIWEESSTRAGLGGISGPYRSLGVILSEEHGKQGWESVQGDDSFEPYRLADGTWRALYGSHGRNQPWRSVWFPRRPWTVPGPGRDPTRCPSPGPSRTRS